MDSSLPLALSLVGSIVILAMYFFFGPVPLVMATVFIGFLIGMASERPRTLLLCLAVSTFIPVALTLIYYLAQDMVGRGLSLATSLLIILIPTLWISSIVIHVIFSRVMG